MEAVEAVEAAAREEERRGGGGGGGGGGARGEARRRWRREGEGGVECGGGGGGGEKRNGRSRGNDSRVSVVKDVQRDSSVETDESPGKEACRRQGVQGSHAAAPVHAKSAHSPTRPPVV